MLFTPVLTSRGNTTELDSYFSHNDAWIAVSAFLDRVHSWRKDIFGVDDERTILTQEAKAKAYDIACGVSSDTSVDAPKVHFEVVKR